MNLPKKILVVEDNHINAIVAMKLLQLWGYEAIHAASGLKAIELCKTDDFDLIIMDLQMPEIDGFQATSEIKKNGFTNPVIALSAESYYLIIDKLEAFGIVDFVGKPLNPEELKKKIQLYIN